MNEHFLSDDCSSCGDEAADVKLVRSLQVRLRRLAQREWKKAWRAPASYEHGYQIGLAVGYEESSKRVARLLRSAKGRP